MQIELKKKAQVELVKIVDYGSLQFGERVAMNFYLKMKRHILQLIDNPYIGRPEPLLEGKRYSYRSRIIADHHKAIYRIDTHRDMIIIVDIWDMRREPKSLVRRLK